MNDFNRLRMPEDRFLPCKLCGRKYLKAEAHWFCIRCRKDDERAYCPKNCKACTAMVEVEWRKKAMLISEYKKTMAAKYQAQKSANCPFVKSTKRRTKGSPKKKTTKVAKIQRTKTKPPKPVVVSSHSRRLAEFGAFLYEDLNPTIPSSLVEKGFTLSEIPSNLKEKYYITRNELLRLLASSSVCYHLSRNRSQFCDENNQIFNANSDGIVSLFASLIKFKANSFGKVIFEIREALLSHVACANPKVISLMIKGPINPKESFFGNIGALKEAVAANKNHVLRRFVPPTRFIKDEPSSSDEMEYAADDPSEASSDSS